MFRTTLTVTLGALVALALILGAIVATTPRTATVWHYSTVTITKTVTN